MNKILVLSITSGLFVDGQFHRDLHTGCSQPMGAQPAGRRLRDADIVVERITVQWPAQKSDIVEVKLASTIHKVNAWKGPVGSTLLANQAPVSLGGEITVAGFAGSPNDVFWKIFDGAAGQKLGESKFHLSCSDQDMNGPEDCGKRPGQRQGFVGFHQRGARPR